MIESKISSSQVHKTFRNLTVEGPLRQQSGVSSGVSGQSSTFRQVRFPSNRTNAKNILWKWTGKVGVAAGISS